LQAYLGIIVICSFFNGEELYIIESSFFVVENPWMILLHDYWRFGATHHSFFVMLKWHAILEIFKHLHHLIRNIEDKLYPKKTIYEKHSMNIACLRITNQKHFDEILTRRLIYTFEKWFKPNFMPSNPKCFLASATWDVYISSNHNLVDLSIHHELAW
jgi:hypothetical protein